MVRHPRAVAAIAVAAALSFALSVSLWFGGDREAGVFVGLWVPSILSLGAFVLSSVASREAAAPRPGPGAYAESRS
jgi:hypothetical protein